MTSEELISQTTAAASSLFPLAHSSVVYRASLAYILQNIKSFIRAIQPLKSKKLEQAEVQALQRLNGLFSHFSAVLPHLGTKWVNAALNWPSNHMHNYIDGFRKTLTEMCGQLSLDPNEIIKFDPIQDQVNKRADFDHLRKALIGARESAISVTNSVDIQQLIEMRLHSISKHIQKNDLNSGQLSKGVSGISAFSGISGNIHGSSVGMKYSSKSANDIVSMQELKQKMDKELAVFESIDIPCEDIKLDQKLGCGGFGTVYCAVRLSTSELLAVKEVRSDRLTMATWASLYSEVATMAPLKHKFVLELVGVHIKEPYRIITRYCPGKSLFDRLHRTASTQSSQASPLNQIPKNFQNSQVPKKTVIINVPRPEIVKKLPAKSEAKPLMPLTPENLTAIAYQVAVGMSFLHSNGIVHRDLKTMNILLDDSNVAKIADFGLAGIMKDNKELIGGVGTPHYTAPEVLERKRYGPKVDVYSYGIILWEMANKQIPFRDKTHQEIFDAVVNRKWRLPINPNVPSNLKNLITKCWADNPNDRPDFSEIVQMFEDGQIVFQGCKPISTEKLDPPKKCPPLHIKYLTSILKNSSDTNFQSVVNFLAGHIDNTIKRILHNENIIDHYYKNVNALNNEETINQKDQATKSTQNIESILILASELLYDDEFPDFLEKVGLKLMQSILSNVDNAKANFNASNEENDEKLSSKQNLDLIAAARFCLKIPSNHLNIIKDLIPMFVNKMNENGAGRYVIRILSRLDKDSIELYKHNIIDFLSKINNVNSINEQADLDALVHILPLIESDLSPENSCHLICILKKDLCIPSLFIDFLISKTSKERISKLTFSMIKAACRIVRHETKNNNISSREKSVYCNESNSFNISQTLIHLIKLCTFDDLKVIASHDKAFNKIHYLLKRSNLITVSLFIVFQLSQVPTVPPLLANHPLLQSILNIKGHFAQRLQLFTSLFSSEQFCTDTTISESVMKLLILAMSEKSPILAKCSLKLIGALTSHPAGCALVSETNLLSLFSQMFLSSTSLDTETSLKILENSAKENLEIPQISLIVSCLMQDLLYSEISKEKLLNTLVQLIQLQPNSIQDHDIQNSLLPLLSNSQTRETILLVLQILSLCDVTYFRSFYYILAYKIFLILSSSYYLYPEIINYSIQIIASLSQNYDINEFLEQTKIINFVHYSSQQIAEKFESISLDLKDSLDVLKQGTRKGSNSVLLS